MWNKFSHCTLLCILNYWKVSFTQKICLHLFANQYLGISIKSRGRVLEVWKVNFLVQRQRQWSKWILCPDNITAITPTVHFVYKGELKCFNAKPNIKSFFKIDVGFLSRHYKTIFLGMKICFSYKEVTCSDKQTPAFIYELFHK